MSKNTEDFLKLMKAETFSNVSVFVPSQNTAIDFKPITVTQQKAIIKDTLGGVNGTILLQRTLNNIITDNVLGDYEFSIIDRSAILVQLRIAYLGNQVKDTAGNPGTLKQVGPAAGVYPDTEQIEHEGIVVTLQTPTLQLDSNYIWMLTASNNFTNPGDLVNEMYVTEIAKFIKDIEFKGIKVTPTVNEGLTIVNQLPTKLISKIMGYIKRVKDIDNEHLLTLGGKQVILNTQFFNDPVS